MSLVKIKQGPEISITHTIAIGEHERLTANPGGQPLETPACLGLEVGVNEMHEPVLSLANVRRGVSDLSALGEVISCHVVRFNDGKKLDGMLYRAAGYITPPAPGRKSKAQVRANATAAEREPE